jgi:hypothetical protein
MRPPRDLVEAGTVRFDDTLEEDWVWYRPKRSITSLCPRANCICASGIPAQHQPHHHAQEVRFRIRQCKLDAADTQHGFAAQEAQRTQQGTLTKQELVIGQNF